MDPVRHLQLQIVDTELVHSHEIADPSREKRIEARLREDGILRDPLIVGSVADIDGFVLLDGTNRKRALAALGFPRVMVQVVDYANQQEVVLKTWCHAARISMAQLLSGAAQIPGVELSALPPLATADVLAAPSTLAVILDRKDRYAVVQSQDHETSRVQNLRSLVNLYKESLTRVDCQPEEVEERAQKLDFQTDETQVLVAFPPFSRSQVVAMAVGDNPIPAGITRHLILSGRALRVNLGLPLLAESLSLAEANGSLEQHLQGLQPRLYREPTVLFDS
jgi:hypothetical protein